MFLLAHPHCGALAGEVAHFFDVIGPRRVSDDAARIEQIEQVAGFDAMVIGGQDEVFVQQSKTFGLHIVEVALEHFFIGGFVVIGRVLPFGFLEHVAVGGVAAEIELKDVIFILFEHCESFESVGNFARHRLAIDAADLLKIGELRNLHSVAAHFPAESPSAERRAFPIVLDEFDIMLLRLEPKLIEAFHIKLADVRRRWFKDHLKLVIMLQSIGVFAIAAIVGSARGLDIGGFPRFLSERAQSGSGVEGSGAHFDIVGLEQHTAFLAPKFLQSEDHILEVVGIIDHIF